MAAECSGKCNLPNFALWDLVDQIAYRDRPLLPSAKEADISRNFYGKKNAVLIKRLGNGFCCQGADKVPVLIERCFWDRSWKPLAKAKAPPEGLPIDCPCTCGQKPQCLDDLVDMVAFRDRPAVRHSEHSPMPGADYDYCGAERRVTITKKDGMFYGNGSAIDPLYWDYSWKSYPERPRSSTLQRVATRMDMNGFVITEDDRKEHKTPDDSTAAIATHRRAEITVADVVDEESQGRQQDNLCKKIGDCICRCFSNR